MRATPPRRGGFPMLERLSRRSVLAGSAVALATLALPAVAFAQRPPVSSKRTRLVILASGGGPRPRKERGSTAHAVVIDGVLYVVDCGNGVARQLVTAGLPL